MKSLHTFLIILLLCITPTIELRGGLPFALATGYSPLFALLFCILFNLLDIPICYLFLDKIHDILMKNNKYRNFFEWRINVIRKKIENSLKKYGYLGLAIFVAIPLPGTGAYSGVIAAWFFNMDRKYSYIAISFGVICAGIIVTIAYLFFRETLFFFFKNVA